jgi:hypothetical protein
VSLVVCGLLPVRMMAVLHDFAQRGWFNPTLKMNLAKPFKLILRISSLGLNAAGIIIKTDWIFEEIH